MNKRDEAVERFGEIRGILLDSAKETPYPPKFLIFFGITLALLAYAGPWLLDVAGTVGGFLLICLIFIGLYGIERWAMLRENDKRESVFTRSQRFGRGVGIHLLLFGAYMTLLFEAVEIGTLTYAMWIFIFGLYSWILGYLYGQTFAWHGKILLGCAYLSALPLFLLGGDDPLWDTYYDITKMVCIVLVGGGYAWIGIQMIKKQHGA